MEEAHRRLLRAALLGKQPDPQDNFVAYLRSIPAGTDIEFERAGDLPRELSL